MENNIEMTEDEITRCKNDILYFVEKYVRIKTDDGDLPLRLTESQKSFLRDPQSYYKTKFNYGKRRRRINQIKKSMDDEN